MAAESSVVLSTPLAASDLRSVTASGWSGGLGNLLQHELRPWVRTRFGLIQAVVLLVALNGFMALPLWLAPRIDSSERAALESQGGALTLGLVLFFRLGIQIFCIGAAILAMSALVGEKQSGTAAWILSKPVSRVAFVAAKLIGLSLGCLVTMVGLNAVVGYLHITLVGGHAPDAGSFVMGSALLALAVLFALALTVMLGAFFNSRGAVVGIAVGALVSQQVVAG